MRLAKDFLDRFRKIQAPQGALKKIVVRVITATTGVSLKESDVSFSKDMVFLRVSSVAKNVIHMARAAILRMLSEDPISRGRIRDIR